jgi:exopolysaccharide production protein ExoZ
MARIVPLYWLLTLVAAGAIVSGLRLFGQPALVPTHLLESLLFVPSFGPGGAVIEPILFVGWSLNYEMLFYLVFAVSLLAGGRRRQGVALAALLIGLMAAGAFSGDPWLRYYGSPVLMQFGAGVAIWHLARIVRPGPRTGWAVVAMAAVAFVAAAVPGSPLAALPEWARNGAPAALLVFGAVALEHAGVAARHGFVLRQGDASYSLYLLHPFVLQSVGKVGILSGLTATGPGVAATVALAGVASLMAAEWCYRRVELPMTRAATALLQVPRRGAPSRSPDPAATTASPRTA